MTSLHVLLQRVPVRLGGLIPAPTESSMAGKGLASNGGNQPRATNKKEKKGPLEILVSLKISQNTACQPLQQASFVSPSLPRPLPTEDYTMPWSYYTISRIALVGLHLLRTPCLTDLEPR
ncbi:hypothetical protein E2C01_035920 [Portunus trituberculatus]|uniref:Uncharacterized protein n=1 Tax=Portunus trituberculatus TaxID=210409 RepID=A0A5B7F5M1_PORTR|nr:hypothetical protein [Portunus trituberculatus]